MKLSIGYITVALAMAFSLAMPPDLIAQALADAPAVQSDSSIRNPMDAFRHGKTRIHFRSFFMATDNAPGFTDYYAQALGGSLHYQTAALKGFRMGIGGAFNHRLAASDLKTADPATGSSNRYEIGLFDVENPDNRNDLDRLEEFWLKYEWNASSVTLGKQILQTPFINYQDGRMRPTVEEGLWVVVRDIPRTRIEGGVLWRISPRSAVRWYEIGESIGLYPKGLNPDGTASGYPEHLESKGIALLGITRQVGEHVQVQVWDQFVENIFNTAFVQADLEMPLKAGHKLFFGVQGMHQDALADGGNADQQRSYFMRGGQSNAVSTQIGWKRRQWSSALAYTHVTADGRFLSPREWGRDPFYTFMPRERLEGSGNSHSVTARVDWTSVDRRWRSGLGYGHFYLPDIREPALNKYAFPSFSQLNLDVRYQFGGWLKGLNAHLLVVHKGLLGETYGNDRAVINKVNMWHYNLILNYIL